MDKLQEVIQKIQLWELMKKSGHTKQPLMKQQQVGEDWLQFWKKFWSVGEMLSNRITCFREIIHERNSQLMQQTIVLL